MDFTSQARATINQVNQQEVMSTNLLFCFQIYLLVLLDNKYIIHNLLGNNNII